MYGSASFKQREFDAFVNGKWVSGVADNVTVAGGGQRVAIEAKFVDDWASSLRNPASANGAKPWAVAEQQKMVDQAFKYSAGFDGGVVYHTNSSAFASHYSKVFSDAGITNFKFVITPAKR